MFQYYYRIFDRYNQKVVSLAILGDDRPNWRPNSYSNSLWGCSMNFQFPVVKLLEYANSSEELETHENVFAVIVLAHLKTMETQYDPAARQGWKFRLVRSLYERGLTAADVRLLFKFIDWMMDLPKALDKLFWQEIQQLQEKVQMPFITTPERYGRIEGLLKGIEKCLKIKFGEDGLGLMPEIRELDDHEKLEAILEAIESVNAPDELRQLWQSENNAK